MPQEHEQVVRGHRVVGPWDDDTLYEGPFVAEAFGSSWENWLNRRADGGDTPRATRIGRKLWFTGRAINEWIERQSEPVSER